VDRPATATTFFTVLTLLADAAVVALAVLAVVARTTGTRGRAIGRVVRVGDGHARGVALLVAATATAGSLYYSEVVGFVPCELCWYQRIAMYPLVAILAVAVLRRDATARWCAIPFVVVGAPLAAYHWLVERVPAVASTSSCSLAAPCTVPPVERLGFVTLAFMDLSAFLLIGALLLLDARAAPPPEAR
jgi:disulfide bond formation protein DsbB